MCARDRETGLATDCGARVTAAVVMGSYLNKPKTDKESEDMENDRLMCGVSSMQGWREKQEVSTTILQMVHLEVLGSGGREIGRNSTTVMCVSAPCGDVG